MYEDAFGKTLFFFLSSLGKRVSATKGLGFGFGQVSRYTGNPPETLGTHTSDAQ